MKPRAAALTLFCLLSAAPAAAQEEEAYREAVAGIELCVGGRWADALPHLDRSIALFPTATALGHRGNAHRALGRPDSAIADYDAVLRQDSRSVVALNNRANAWRDKGRSDSALRDLDAAVRIDSRPPGPRLNGGWTRYALLRLTEAAAEARAYVALAGRNDPAAPYFALLGHFASLRAGRQAEARRFLADALAPRPGLDTAAWPYPILRHLRREIPEAALLARAGDGPFLVEARTYAGLGLFFAGRRDAALAHLRWVVEHAPPTMLEREIARGEVLRLAPPARRPPAPRRR